MSLSFSDRWSGLNQKVSVGVSDLPPIVSALCGNTRYGVRPMHDPRLLPGAEDGDRFHPAIRSPEDFPLPHLTNKEFSDAREVVAKLSNSSWPVTPGSDIVVTPLGTSSAVPTKYRNGNARISISCSLVA